MSGPSSDDVNSKIHQQPQDISTTGTQLRYLEILAEASGELELLYVSKTHAINHFYLMAVSKGSKQIVVKRTPTTIKKMKKLAIHPPAD